MRQETKKQRVYLVYRQMREGLFSIEKVFQQVLSQLRQQSTVEEFFLPQSSIRPDSIFKNVKEVRKLSADIYHVTGDVHYIVLALPASKTILTIHDCVFLHSSKGIKRWLLKKFFLDLPVKHCRLITTISEKSRQEILQYSGCPAGKVKVVPNPVGNHFYFSAKEFNHERPVILFIGSTPNKNLERVIYALEGVSCYLFIVGRVNEHYKHLLQEKNIAFQLFWGLSEQELADSYAKSDIVIFPSLYEGFGLPIIEGQKSGRPVITSNISPMREVAGEGACLVDPLDVQSIKAGVQKVIEDRAYRESIVQKGFINVQQYEPAVIANQYLQLYNQVIAYG